MTPKGKKTRTSAGYGKAASLLITYEEIGLFPRSFSRVLDRFLKQVFSDVELFVVQEYRFYRYLFLTTFQSIFLLFFVPFLINFFAKNYLVRPLADYFWNTQQTEIFLNSYQQKRAFAELKDFEEKLYFESLVSESDKRARPELKICLGRSLPKPKTCLGQSLPESRVGYFFLKEKSTLPEGLGKTLPALVRATAQPLPLRSLYSDRVRNKSSLNSNLASRDLNKLGRSIYRSAGRVGQGCALPDQPYSNLAQRDLNLGLCPAQQGSTYYATPYLDSNIGQKMHELAMRYNDQSIDSITNFFADFFSFVTLLFMFYYIEVQINIAKSFLLEVFFGLNDAIKSLLILLTTDLLVGYHSPNIWELFFESIFNHYGIPESETGIFLLVATLPVLLDVLFKYLIFRHLNRASPATVATYHAMIE